MLNFREYGSSVDIVAVSGNGKGMLTVCAVDTTQIWGLDTNECIAELKPVSPLHGSDLGPMTYGFQTYIEAVAMNENARHYLA